MHNGRFGLADADFWSAPRKNEEQVVDEFVDNELLGLVLDAPREASIYNRSTLPFAALYLRTFYEEAQVNAERAMILVASRHEDGALFVGPALLTDKKIRDEEPDEDPGPGFSAEYFVADAAQQLGLPWERGTYTLALMIRERLSNVCHTRVGRIATDYQDDAVEAYIEQRRSSAMPPSMDPVWPPLPEIRGAITRALDGGVDPFPNFRQRSDSPALPEGVGLNFTIDRVAEPGDGRRCMLKGSFRLPVGPLDRVPFDPESGRPIDVGAPGATAVLPITLIATGTTYVGPMTIRMRIPSFDPVPPEGGTVTGFFNIDLFEISVMRDVPDTYFFTAFSRDIVRGPVPVGIAPRLG